ncbi:hypothetical protein Fbal_3255 [Ferrimonas balearica DSM 9799]|uniref:Lipoprotein n=1 Tax=Ferrimonas balearica (strain DSM 9799 / CCM 4581 / KCTC 23876 / PAT) TaxID=550540 RepID=E1SWJ2_FERBD|nr:hypothetical protein [Ferrimonas balearica]ADN77454.1 hypothetical protein Fbal_3255 [Ferrimonas balearica DSM 9799]
MRITPQRFIALLLLGSALLAGCLYELTENRQSEAQPTKQSVINALRANNAGTHQEPWGSDAREILRRWPVEQGPVRIWAEERVAGAALEGVEMVEKRLGFPLFEWVDNESNAQVVMLRRSKECSLQVNGGRDTSRHFETPPVESAGMLKGPIYVHLNQRECGDRYNVPVRAAMVAAGFVRLHTMRSPRPSEWKALETLYHNPPGTTLADADILW